ncbi:MAG: hypothetical protein IJJ15_04995, partial [Ruminococcus sp.]|nr:hypothetical protein [Ruminococcus sp.]
FKTSLYSSVMRRQTLTIILGGFSFAQLFYLPPVEPGVYFHALKAPIKNRERKQTSVFLSLFTFN